MQMAMRVPGAAGLVPHRHRLQHLDRGRDLLTAGPYASGGVLPEPADDLLRGTVLRGVGGRSSESRSTKTCCSRPGSSLLCPTKLTRCARITEASCSVWPWVKLAQELPERRRRVHPCEQLPHAARADHIQVVDAVGTGRHPRDDSGQFPGRVRSRRRELGRLELHPLHDELGQAGPLGQRKHRRQPGKGHEIRLVEHRSGTRPPIR